MRFARVTHWILAFARMTVQGYSEFIQFNFANSNTRFAREYMA